MLDIVVIKVRTAEIKNKCAWKHSS